MADLTVSELKTIEDALRAKYILLSKTWLAVAFVVLGFFSIGTVATAWKTAKEAINSSVAKTTTDQIVALKIQATGDSDSLHRMATGTIGDTVNQLQATCGGLVADLKARPARITFSSIGTGALKSSDWKRDGTGTYVDMPVTFDHPFRETPLIAVSIRGLNPQKEPNGVFVEETNVSPIGCSIRFYYWGNISNPTETRATWLAWGN